MLSTRREDVAAYHFAYFTRRDDNTRRSLCRRLLSGVYVKRRYFNVTSSYNRYLPVRYLQGNIVFQFIIYIFELNQLNLLFGSIVSRQDINWWPMRGTQK